MGLTSAMTTALTGLTAAETQIDVSGNNLANSQTVGFKASDVIFATQFLRTLSAGSGPSETNGGTDPKQLGLGVQVAGVTPDFSQGTIEISSSVSDMAVQGEGFFMVEGNQGETLYTRNGIFNTNSDDELVTVTGNRVLGFGVNELYELQTSELAPLTIPLGATASAQATENVYLTGNLTPTGDVATVAEVIESAVLGDGSAPRPDVQGANPTTAARAAEPDASGTTAGAGGSGSSFLAGDQYEYVFTFTDAAGQETMPSQATAPVTIAANGEQVTLSDLPPSPLDDGSPLYDQVNVFRRKLTAPAGDPEANYQLVSTAPQGAATVVDNGLPPISELDDSSLNGTYSYLVTFSGSGVPESRPSELVGPVSLVDGRVRVDNLPPIPSGPDIPAYDSVNVYRNLSTNASDFFLVSSLSPGDAYIDARSDAEISDLSDPANRQLDLDGPKMTNATLLTDVVQRNGLAYENVFEAGELTYTGRKGGNDLAEKTFEVTDTTTVGEFLQFLSDASGIQAAGSGDTDPVPPSENRIPGESGTLAPGVVVTPDGRLRVVSNNGTANSVDIASSAFQMNSNGGATSTPNLGFSSVQESVGQSAMTNFVVYDSLGMPLNVRVTTALEARDGDATTYRWYAESGDNDPPGADHATALGTGLISFDGEGNLIQGEPPSVALSRADIPSAEPLDFRLDFSNMSGFATDDSQIAATRQDGSPVGTLTSYNVGEDGRIMGVFSNGTTQTLGQVRLARFANPTGLVQHGENMYAVGFNSGLPVEGDPGELGLGSIISGAVELSNADIGTDLVDLMLASTQYRANSRVISTSQQLLDELMNMRR